MGRCPDDSCSSRRSCRSTTASADPTNIVTNIEFSPDTPNVFKYNQNVNLTFNYTTNQAGGVRIFARPFSGANLSPNYAAHGSPVYPTRLGHRAPAFSP